MAGFNPAIRLKEPLSLDGRLKGGHDAESVYMQPVGFGRPPILQACFAGP